MNNLKNVSNENLLQMYANASTTSGCGGHQKGKDNEWARERYALELRSRNIYVPKDIHEYIESRVGEFKINTTIPEGVFNGEGSY
jgi:hypothetical protein